MLLLHSLRLKNIVHFKEAYVPVHDNGGFVIVSGHNKDSRSSNQNNGAGKSLLFSAISNVLYGASPSSTLKNTRKDLLSKGSEIELRFIDNNRNKIRVIQTPSKWGIFENGVDQEVHRISNQQDHVASLFPLTQDEFYSYVYLSSIQGQRIHFQVDRPAERLKFITSIFQLDSYDKLKQYFTQQLARIKDEQVRFDVIESKLLSINVQLEKLNWSKEQETSYEDNKEEFERLKKRRSKLSKKQSAIHRTIFILETLLKKIEERETIASELPDKPLDVIRRGLKARLRAIHELEIYQREMASYEKNKARIQKQLDSIKIPGDDLEALQSKHDKVAAALERTRSTLAESRSARNRLSKLKKDCDILRDELTELGFDAASDVPDNIDDELSICETTLQLKKLLESDSGSVCPTCLQEVDIDSIRKNVKKAQARAQELRTIKQAQRIVQKLVALEEQCSEIVLTDDIAALENKEEALAQKLVDICEGLDALKEHRSLVKSLDRLECPVAPERVPKNINVDELEAALELCATYERVVREIEATLANNDHIPDLHTMTEEDLHSLREEHDQLDKTLRQIDKDFNVLMKSVSEFDLKRGEYQLLMKQRLEHEAELEGIRPILDKRDLYKALEKAYGAKGLKVERANEILALLEANMNKYSALIFAEPFSFKLYANDHGVMCDVVRHKTGLTTDSRLLSGSESDSFKLLFMLSLLVLVPESRRTNFVVLDEPDSHMDEVTRSLFAEQYVPFLRSLVPTVFLITPKDHDVFQDYELWTVVKEKGVSTLEYRQ